MLRARGATGSQVIASEYRPWLLCIAATRHCLAVSPGSLAGCWLEGLSHCGMGGGCTRPRVRKGAQAVPRLARQRRQMRSVEHEHLGGPGRELERLAGLDAGCIGLAQAVQRQQHLVVELRGERRGGGAVGAAACPLQLSAKSPSACRVPHMLRLRLPIHPSAAPCSHQSCAPYIALQGWRCCLPPAPCKPEGLFFKRRFFKGRLSRGEWAETAPLALAIALQGGEGGALCA